MIYIVLWDILKSHEIRHRINLTVVAHCVGLIQCQIVHVGYGGCVETRSTTMNEARQIHNSCIYIYIYIYEKFYCHNSIHRDGPTVGRGAFPPPPQKKACIYVCVEILNFGPNTPN